MKRKLFLYFLILIIFFISVSTSSKTKLALVEISIYSGNEVKSYYVSFSNSENLNSFKIYDTSD